MKFLKIMMEIKGVFKLNNDKIEQLYNYLGAILYKKNFNKVQCWEITRVDCIKYSVVNV